MATIEVMWSLRDGAWHVRGFSIPGWRRMNRVHLAEGESDETLLRAAREMFPEARAQGHGVTLRRLAPGYRLPKGAVGDATR